MKKVHLIGIGGTGLSAIATLLKERGYAVTGSDRTLSPLARQLTNQGILVYTGHDPANVRGADLVIRSSAVKDENPEVIAARELGIPVLKRQEFLGELMQGSLGIAVAGTHGKTTTTAMLAWTLTALGQDPSYIIGGLSKNLGGNAHSGKGDAFVIEADEYDYMFLGLRPRMILLTTIEHDHPDIFPSVEIYRQAFSQFIERLEPQGTLLVCADDPAARMVAGQAHVDLSFSYGLEGPADYLAKDLEMNSQGGYSFTLMYADKSGEHAYPVTLQVPGRHNVANALAVLAAVHRLGLPVDAAAAALAQFSGTGRRFDVLGQAGGVIVIDDYAHHPTEVRATLEAARARYPQNRIWAVWQPHTYSRTLALMDQFVQSFKLADEVLVTEVYAAREQNPNFSARELVTQMDHPSTHFVPGLKDAIDYLLAHLRSGDVLLVLSAGDADQVSAAVLANLQDVEQQHG